MKLFSSENLNATRLGSLKSYPDVLLGAGLLGVLLVILVPLPPSFVDPLLILNLTISLVVLLTAACVVKPLEFSVFPSLLLVTTFFRLALNIATTRLILGNAADGNLAAGQVVLTFGGFVAGDNPIIGMIVFMVIVIVQFVVLTKGASRISEVAARFQLDSMPGKQMSIDADLSAGLIDRETAKEQRALVTQEADFYGSMDGASKFVRGDAIAGLVIVAINVVGGIAVGFLYHGMSLGEAVNVFSKLTIGDGLVSQVPALMVSIASALLVTRSAASQHLGRDLGQQMLSNDQVLFVASGFLLVLLPSGLPPLALVAGSLICAYAGFMLRQKNKAQEERSILDQAIEEEIEQNATPAAPVSTRPDVRTLMRVDPLVLEVGYRLLPLVDEARGGELVERLAKTRETLALELGLILPPIQIRDSRSIRPSEYSILLRGDHIGRWEIYPRGRLLVTARSLDELLGEDREFDVKPGPVLDGFDSSWIPDEELLENVDLDDRVLSPAEAIASHIEHAVRAHAADVLTREEVSRMLDDLGRHSPALVADLIPRVLDVGEVHRVLQGLLMEGVSIRDLESVLEVLGSPGTIAESPSKRIEDVRRRMARSVCAASTGDDGRLHVVLLDPALEEFLLNSIDLVDGEATLRLDPQTTESIGTRTAEVLASLKRDDCQPAVLASPRLRPLLWRALRHRAPSMSVLSYDEVLDDRAVETHGSIHLDPSRMPGLRKEVNAAQ